MSTESSSIKKKVELYQCNPQSLIEYYFYYGWNKNNTNVMKEILDEHIKFRGGLARVDGTIHKYRGRDGLIQYMHDAHISISNKRCEIIDIIIDNHSIHSKAAVKIKVCGRYQGCDDQFFDLTVVPSTSKPVGIIEISYYAAVHFTFNETCTKIIEIWALPDIDCLKNQIGAIESTTPFLTSR